MRLYVIYKKFLIYWYFYVIVIYYLYVVFIFKACYGFRLWKFPFPSAGHDSPDWVVTKLVSEPRLEMYDLGCLIVVDCVFF